MRYRTLRNIASIILLVTYLPMVISTSLHMHHETIDSQDECMQCVGHIETAHHHEHDCLYCLFLSLDYQGESVEQSATFLPATGHCSVEITERTEMIHHGVASLRAPPTVG